MHFEYGAHYFIDLLFSLTQIPLIGISRHGEKKEKCRCRESRDCGISIFHHRSKVIGHYKASSSSLHLTDEETEALRERE